MPFLPDDERLLRHALELAEAAAAFASPNPAVGCILERNGEPLGMGAHRYDWRDHAEIVALKLAAAQQHNTAGATAYVTLEPCAHHGRTGPCAEALVAAGITRCVVATLDPNPLVRGQGLAILRAAGIDVVVADPTSPVAQSARRLIDAFAFSIQHKRPFVTLKTAVSADGKLSPSPATRTATAPHWLTGPAAREDVQGLRHLTDALLTGIGTVLADNPELTDRTGRPRRVPLLRAVLDSDLRTPLDSRLIRSAKGDLLLFAAQETPTSRETALRQAGAEVLRLPAQNGRLPLALVLDTLAAIPVRSVMVEAGSTLNGQFLAKNLVDKVVLYQAPTLLGPGALSFAQGASSPGALLSQLTCTTLKNFPNGAAEDLRISGYLHDPWSEFNYV